MSTALTHTTLLTGRALRGLTRVPVFLAINLVQPVIWLLLFGALFRSVVEIPGFDRASGSFLEFLTPGVIMMMGLFGSAWAGTGYIQDMERGVMDRFLTAPTSRGAMMVAILIYQAVTTVVQSLIVLGIALLAGARFDGGLVGVLVLLLAAVLLVSIFAALSNAIALLTRQQEALIGISQLITLPLTFLSSGIMDLSLAPDWVRGVAVYNPFEWAVIVGRQALLGSPDWPTIWGHLGLLTALTVVMVALATRAFRTYQRST
jgi:ABC-2 type transport system permease protein